MVVFSLISLIKERVVLFLTTADFFFELFIARVERRFLSREILSSLRKVFEGFFEVLDVIIQDADGVSGLVKDARDI